MAPAANESPGVTITWRFQGAAPRGLLDAARPCFNVFCEPDRASAQAGDWRWEVRTVDVSGRRPAADANYLGHLGESREPELHAGTVDRRPEVTEDGPYL
jgi:hypothetical protein